MQGRPKCNARQLTRGREKKEGHRTSSGTLKSERNMTGDQGNYVFQKKKTAVDQPCSLVAVGLPFNAGPLRKALMEASPLGSGDKGSPQFWMDGRAGGQQFSLGARPGTHRMGAKRRNMKECWGGGPRGKHGWSAAAVG